MSGPGGASAAGGASASSELGPALEGALWVRLGFVDVFGTSNSVQLPVQRFAEAVAHGEPFDGSALQGRSRALEADMRLRPDPTTLHRVGSVAQVACTVLTPDGMPWPADPRTALVGLVSPAGPLAELAAAWTASTELEFYLLERDEFEHDHRDPRPVDRAGYFDDAEGIGIVVVRAVAERLAEYGIGIVSCHHEAGPGQYELDLAQLDPVGLADALVLAKQTVRELAAEEGIAATFMARPFNDLPGSGLHLHQQVAGLVDVGGSRLTEDGAAFVAGQLAHARALAALASPTVNSYKRLHSGAEAPGAAVWAHVNRAALIRVGSEVGTGGGGPGIEFRGADPSANPYLLVAGLLVAAADGMSSGLRLGPPVEEAAGTFDPADTSEVRYEPLPRSLDEALDALLADDAFADAFDARLLNHLVDGRRAEAEAYRSYVTRWELSRYLDD
jgi:glutamine synthetase